MQFDVTILGSNAAIPAYNRYPTSQVLNYNGNLFMIDCGEGAQFRMNDFSIKRAHLNHIFISHLHGDHYFGLVPLLTSFNLNWREHPLHLYGPPALQEIIEVQFKHSLTQLRYELIFHPVLADASKVIYEDDHLTVETILLTHRLPTTGFLFKEKQHPRKILAEKITEYNIPYQQIVGIKNGGDFVCATGETIPNAELTLDPAPPRSYAYCSDTVYIETFIEQIKGVNLLYHESTFIDEHKERAAETLHTTTKQAARIAKLAGAQTLLIGHFSARYQDLSLLLTESRDVFHNTHLAEEGKTFEVG
ncbi:MAG TPA: ribonuclease Z [Chitinophagales bacterium]|nr:ribonuclease Z [Chitinophagales bacterium]